MEILYLYYLDTRGDNIVLRKTTTIGWHAPEPQKNYWSSIGNMRTQCYRSNLRSDCKPKVSFKHARYERNGINQSNYDRCLFTNWPKFPSLPRYYSSLHIRSTKIRPCQLSLLRQFILKYFNNIISPRCQNFSFIEAICLFTSLTLKNVQSSKIYSGCILEILS